MTRLKRPGSWQLDPTFFRKHAQNHCFFDQSQASRFEFRHWHIPHSSPPRQNRQPHLHFTPLARKSRPREGTTWDGARLFFSAGVTFSPLVQACANRSTKLETFELCFGSETTLLLCIPFEIVAARAVAAHHSSDLGSTLHPPVSYTHLTLPTKA